MMNTRIREIHEKQIAAMTEYCENNDWKMSGKTFLSKVDEMISNYIDIHNKTRSPKDLKSVSSFLLVSELAFRKAFPDRTKSVPMGYYIGLFYSYMIKTKNVHNLDGDIRGGYLISAHNAIRLIKQQVV